MKRFLLLMLVCIISFSFAQTQREEAGLKGDVKSVITKEKADWFEGEARITREQFFSQGGYLSEFSFYSYSFSDGSIRFKATTNYDDQGEAIARLDIAPDDSVVGSVIYRYNSDGNLEEKLTFDADNTISKEERYEYDTAGNETSWLVLRDGVASLTVETEYDSTGQKLKRSSYDATGRLSRETLYKDNDSETDRFEEAYDYDEDGTVECVMTLYNKAGNIESRERCDDSEEIFTVAYSYNENDLEIKRDEVMSINSTIYTSIYTTVYEFDEQGNWIKKTIEEETGTGFKSIYQILYRNIEYY